MKRVILSLLLWLKGYGGEDPSITEFHYNPECCSFSVGVWSNTETYISIWYCDNISDQGNQLASKWIATTFVNTDPILTTFPDNLVGERGYFWVSFGWPIWHTPLYP